MLNLGKFQRLSAHVYCITVGLLSQHLEAGIDHLSKADQRIFAMKVELEQLQPEVQLKAKVLSLMLVQLQLSVTFLHISGSRSIIAAVV